MTYRDDAPSLRAECERLRAEVARLRARVPMRWAVPMLAPGNPPAAELTLFCVGAVAAWCAWYFVVDGWTRLVVRFAAVVVAALLVWALAFVRRVPADGARP